ncbi:phosphohistidine phosphatase SixA [Ideonella sp. YS5]|uniref:phosphohistidine phosphatase SixA n=1 Tax=Ideonella sp. YS5 TaxID=3453714 RepID=UPI003EE8B3F0
MDLILWRHAEAEELSAGVDDPARGLTSKGERHARRVAEWLNQVLPHSTKILVSPALRTRQTAEALERKFKVSESLAPEGTVDGLLAAVRWPDAREPVLVVGHQPTLGLAAAYLMTGPRLTHGDPEGLLPWSIRKGGVWWLRHRPREDRGEVVLVAVRSPELV